MHWVVVSNFAFFSAAFFSAGWGHTKRGGGLASLPFVFLVVSFSGLGKSESLL